MQKQKRVRKNLLMLVLVLLLLGGVTTVYSQSTPGLGDVNDDSYVDIVDALLIAQFYVGLQPANFIIERADANDSGDVDIVDALVVAQFYVGLIDTLPPGTQATPEPTEVPGATPTTIILKDNPFVDAVPYVNKEWSDMAIAGGGEEIAYYNTAICLDRIGAITEGIGLRGHLDATLAQGANLITINLCHLPKDCDFESMYLPYGTSYFQWYTSEFIDPIVTILSDTNYRRIRKVMIIEPETLANLVTNLNNAQCMEMNGPGGYVDMIRYAINELNTVPFVYNYVDIASSGWLGWPDNFKPAAQLISNTIKGTNEGVNSIHGFISNVANYTPLEEPFLPDPLLNVNGSPIYFSKFYEYNKYFGELKYVQDMYAEFVSLGFPTSIGMLIDTSRNGWGGPNRPTQVSTSTDLDTYVNESRIDRREHRGNWCNQPGGIGERPRVNPAPHIDAYVWAWAPGLSDGVSEPGIMDPDFPYSIYDRMCGPNEQSMYNSEFSTGAIPAPPFKQWNQAHFEMLLQNAYPPLQNKLDNPFEGANMYVNPEWSALAAAGGGAAIADNNTGIWLDTVKSITDGMGLRGHLDEAISQGSNLILLVLYDLPNRSCLANEPNGEFLVEEDGINRYMTEFIDPIITILSDPAYKDLRIVTILEPNSLANMISGLDVALCAEVVSTGAYTTGIRYALNQLNTLPNTYTYIPMTEASWLGWDSNLEYAIEYFSSVIRGAHGGVKSISGFATNTSNYVPLEEPFLPDPGLKVSGQPIKSSLFYEYNPHFDELDFVESVYNRYVNEGFPSSIGIIINTSRNGWGGPNRPTHVSSSINLETYVNESRVDRRLHRGNWCNQPGGIGERPRANPAPHIDAYVWAWPPGLSDGASSVENLDSNDLTWYFMRMCDPEGQSKYNSDFGTGALPAPHFGYWNQPHFELLLQNAYPPVN